MNKKNIFGLTLFWTLGASAPAPTATLPTTNLPVKSVTVAPTIERKAFVELSSEQGFELALKKDSIVVVKFIADWSPTSRDTTVDNKILAKYQSVAFYTYPYIKGNPLAAKYFVNGVPYYVGFNKGKQVRSKGQMDEQEFEDFIAALQGGEENPFA